MDNMNIRKINGFTVQLEQMEYMRLMNSALR